MYRKDEEEHLGHVETVEEINGQAAVWWPAKDEPERQGQEEHNPHPNSVSSDSFRSDSSAL